MEDLKNQLWRAININPVWPSELMENIKDPDYKKIEVTPLDNGCKVQLVFIENGELISAKYIFDHKDFLIRASIDENGSESIIYDRENEINTIITKINSSIATQTVAI